MARRIRSKKPKRQTRYSILIVTTGTRTERLYLEKIRQEHYQKSNQKIEITIKTSTDSPETAVSKYLKRHQNHEYDEFWFVVDKDDDDLTRFILLCKQHNVNGVITSPCFEVWLVAHYQQVGNFQSPIEAQRQYRQLAALSQKEQKTIPSQFPWDQVREACDRSRLPGRPEPAINTIPEPPASTMPHLLRRLGLVE